jgi:eukaryotic-like serine/threonine-protein kinase
MEKPSSSSSEPRPRDRIGHYELVSEIGRGGMGIVYEARDLSLGREVALKRPLPRLSTDARSLKRFLREASLASRLSHPHIMPIFEVFEHQGVPWLAMPLVEGRSLRTLLGERGPLPVRDTLRYAEDLAEALRAAHDRGVLHRDINPNNVIVTSDGRVLLADFGLAYCLTPPEEDSAASTRSTPLTGEGQPVGTPGYVSPEQALGHPADRRSDIFSLGAVLYEMCTGRGPFKSPSASETLDLLLHREPVPIARLNYEVPEEFERIIRKSFAKSPDERYQDARDLLTDARAVRRRFEHDEYAREHPAAPRTPAPLPRRAVLAAAAGLLLVAVGVVVARRLGPATAPPRVHTLAVSNFQNLAGDPGLDYFSNGMTGEIVARLAGLRQLFVVRAGAGAGPDLILEGGVEKKGDAVRIEYRLTDQKHRRSLGASQIEGTIPNLFSLQDQVAEAIADRLRGELGQPIRYVAPRVPTQDMVAYDLYLQARDFFDRQQDPQNIDRTIELAREAEARAPTFAQAFALSGIACFRKYEQSQKSDWVEKARADCERSASLDPTLAIARVCLGTIHNGLGQPEQAAAEFLKAIELDATSDAAYTGLGLAHQALGKPDEAEKAFQKAVTLYPGYWVAHDALGAFYYRRARYEEATRELEQAIDLAPDNPTGYSSLGGIYISMGRYEEAIVMLEKAITIRPTYDALANLGMAYYNLRRFDEAVRTFEKAITFPDADCATFTTLARSYYWAPGRRGNARAAFKRSIQVCRDRLGINPRDPDAHLLLAYNHAMLDETDETLAQLEEALSLRPTDPEYMFFAGLIHNRLGHRNRALDWLERAVKSGYSTAEIRSTVELDDLHADPRFMALLAKK